MILVMIVSKGNVLILAHLMAQRITKISYNNLQPSGKYLENVNLKASYHLYSSILTFCVSLRRFQQPSTNRY